MAAEGGSPSAALDLTLCATDMRKKYCPFGRNKGAQYPPPTWRTSEAKVREWYGLSRDRQVEEKQKWASLTKAQKKKAEKEVPGFVANPPTRRPSVARSTRSSQQRTQRRTSSATPRPRRSQEDVADTLPGGMASNEAERKETLDRITRGGKQGRKKKRSRTDKAKSTAGQNDFAARDSRAACMRGTANFAHTCQPESQATSHMPRQYALTIIVNEIEDHNTNGGRPSKKRKKSRDKPQMFAVGHGRNLKNNPVLKHVQKAIKNPNDYDIHYLLQDAPDETSSSEETGNEENIPPEPTDLPTRIENHLQGYSKSRSRPSRKVTSNRETSQNVPPDAVIGVMSPSKRLSNRDD